MQILAFLKRLQFGMLSKRILYERCAVYEVQQINSLGVQSGRRKFELIHFHFTKKLGHWKNQKVEKCEELKNTQKSRKLPKNTKSRKTQNTQNASRKIRKKLPKSVRRKIRKTRKTQTTQNTQKPQKIEKYKKRVEIRRVVLETRFARFHSK